MQQGGSAQLEPIGSHPQIECGRNLDSVMLNALFNPNQAA